MSKNKLPWFPCYPDKWLKDTRHMTDTQARVYWDLLCKIYEHNGSLPSNDKWIAHELHVHINKWKAVKRFLFKDGKIVEHIDGTITNKKAAEVCMERRVRTESLGGVRGVVTGGGNRGGLLGGVEPELPFGINEGTPKTASLHSHLHIVQSNKEEERIQQGPFQASAKDGQNDDEERRVQQFPGSLKKALTEAAGEELALELILTYVRKGYDKGAKSIYAGFRAWVAQNHGIKLPKANQQAVATLAEAIVDQCGKDQFGNPIVALPNGEQLSARRSRTTTK